MRTLFLLIAASLYGGQSLTLLNRNASASLAAQDKTQPWRVEMYAHDVDLGPARNLAEFPAYGFQIRVIGVGNALSLNTFAWNDGESGTCQFNPGPAFYLRLQRDPVARTVTCEAWDVDGVRIFSGLKTFTGNSSDTGANVFVGGSSSDATVGNIAFLRIHSTLVPVNSRPPVTFDNVDRLHEWKFDNSLTDEVGSVTLTSGGGSAVYVSTPNQGNYSRPKVKPTSWSDWTSLRTGTSEELTGSDSYSQADASNSVTCLWQQLSGPSRLVFSDQTACDPVVSGALPGPYTFQLTVEGVSGAPGTSTIAAGAIPTDNNGVVANSAAADAIFGPMIAFGRNPWGGADRTALTGLKARNVAGYEARYSKEWLDYKTGTVAYKGFWLSSGAPRAVLDGSINATDMAIPVVSTAGLTLTFPTAVQIGFNGEYVLIASNTGNTLNVAPNGRGWGGTTATSHSSGAVAYQSVAFGTGTAFLADYCGGDSGPAVGTGSVTAGTVAINAASTTLTGSGTNWTTGGGGVVFPGMIVRFQGTISAVPFTFVARVSSVGSTTSITLDRAFPAAAANVSGASYRIYNDNRSWSPRWTRPDASVGHAIFDRPACISDSQLIFGGGLESYTDTQQTGMAHSGFTGTWSSQGGNGTPNFYDEVAANYALYLRSGSQEALEAARWIGDVWAKSPWIDQGWGSSIGIPRNIGALGITASVMVDGRDDLYTIRKLASQGEAKINQIGNDCTLGDLREEAFMFSWVALAAQFDTANQAAWRAVLDDILARDQACQAANGSYKNYIYFSPGHAVTMTNGSNLISGTDMGTGICASTWNGTVNATNGSATVTGSGIPTVPTSPVGHISITGTRGGQPYIWRGPYTGSGGTITIAAPWTGDSGSLVAVVHNDENMLSIGTSNSDPDTALLTDCYYVSSTELRLTNNWAGATGSKNVYRSNITGVGVQPFQAGIKALQYRLARQAAADPAPWQTLSINMGNWMRTVGHDPYTRGLAIGVEFANCQDVLLPTGYSAGPPPTNSVPGNFIQTGCQTPVTGFGSQESRILNAEAQTAASDLQRLSPSSTALAWGDNFYGALYGVPSLTQGGLPTDDGIGNAFGDTASMNNGKWYGFQFGVGMAHQWPAVRVGGLAPADPVTVGTSVAALSGETGAPTMIYTFATGETENAPCSAGTAGWYCPGVANAAVQREVLGQLVRQMPGGELRGERRPVRLR
jgi:hypothetical protein